VAVDVTAGQTLSIWSTGLIDNTALCHHDNYDGHLRAESHDLPILPLMSRDAEATMKIIIH